jgi:hypothetical protein
LVEAERVVHDIGKKHLKDVIAAFDDGNDSFEELPPVLVLNLSDKMQAEPSIVSAGGCCTLTPLSMRSHPARLIEIDLIVREVIGTESIDGFRDGLLLEKSFFYGLVTRVRIMREELLMIDEHIYKKLCIVEVLRFLICQICHRSDLLKEVLGEAYYILPLDHQVIK